MKKTVSKHNLPEAPLPRDGLTQIFPAEKKDGPAALTLRYEVLARWASEQWKQRHPGQPCIVLCASENCGNNLARQRIKTGRKLKSRVRFTGYEMVDCPHVVAISDYRVPGRTTTLAESVGAFLFSFTADEEPFEALYVSSHYRDEDTSIIAIAIVPGNRLEAWAAFEAQCNNAVRYLERRQDVFIIGGTNAFFKPTVDWEDVILPEVLKNDLRDDLEAFLPTAYTFTSS